MCYLVETGTTVTLALCDWSQLQQKRRKLARKHFSPRTGSTFYQSMADVSSFEVKEFLFRLSEQVGENSGDIHLKPLIQQACANMFCNYMCSSRFDYDDGEFKKIVRCFDEIFWEINQGHIIDFLPWLSPFYLSHIKKIVKWSETIRYFILNRIIAEKETNMQTTHLDDDFTYDLLKSLADNDGITRNNIIYMLEDFIGGHSAIGNLVMLALAYIAKHPHVGTRIQNEIDRVLDDCPRIITQNDANDMPYTMCTIYEVLRSCSSPIVPHVATADVVIGDYDVAKGTIVFINNYDLNTNPKYWKNPTDFDPSRFLVEDTSTNPSQSESETKRLKSYIPHFLPFSIGRRTCIGQSLVKGFSFTLIANILNAYNVSTNDLSKIKIYPACLALPPDTFSIKLIPRSLYQ
ncbi:cytochrome P450 307a1-like isoform X2 [Haematobia irritans]|uniref:cytochrome P450 307a1-like isoform X2 n=1 Tax=Haematobia irritans TaxID=7368 RepID=UPI003F505DF8